MSPTPDVGQFIPWSWMARRVYRQFVHGLTHIRRMQVFLRAEQERGDRCASDRITRL
jgi:hypothetical protein